MRERDPQREWIAGGNALIREGSGEFGRVNELHVRVRPRGALQADIEVHDFQLVLDEWPPGLAILAAPNLARACNPVSLPEGLLGVLWWHDKNE